MELAAVAARAGVSPGLPYRYFKSKSALLVAVVDDLFDLMEAAAYRPAFEEVSDDWWEREKARISTLVGVFYEEPLVRIVISKLAGDAAVVQARQQRVTRQVRGAAANIARGQALGRVPAHVDAELAGALLMGGVMQALQAALERPERPPRAHVERVLHEFMRRALEIPHAPGGAPGP